MHKIDIHLRIVCKLGLNNMRLSAESLGILQDGKTLYLSIIAVRRRLGFRFFAWPTLGNDSWRQPADNRKLAEGGKNVRLDAGDSPKEAARQRRCYMHMHMSIRIRT